jgi:DNA-binding response OmpR family regulator
MKDARPARAPVRFGAFELEPESGELRKQGLKVKLQEQPFQILQILLEHPGKVVCPSPQFCPALKSTTLECRRESHLL